MSNLVRGLLYGMAVGSAMSQIKESERITVTDIVPPEGKTKALWSNNLSLALGLADILTDDFELDKIRKVFVDWYENGFWSVSEIRENINIDEQTLESIRLMQQGKDLPVYKGDYVSSGSLVHVMPLSLYLADKPAFIRTIIVKDVTELSHRADLAIIANVYLAEFLRNLYNGLNLMSSYLTLQEIFPVQMKKMGFSVIDIEQFGTLLFEKIWERKPQIMGYANNIVDTLEIAMWSVFTSNSFVDTVTKAVNFSSENNIIGTVAGGIAGIVYGYENIPDNWISSLALSDKIGYLADSLNRKYFGSNR